MSDIPWTLNHVKNFPTMAFEHIQKLQSEVDELKRDPYKGQWKRKYFTAKARVDELEAKCDWKCLGISRKQYEMIQAEGIEELGTPFTQFTSHIPLDSLIITQEQLAKLRNRS